MPPTNQNFKPLRASTRAELLRRSAELDEERARISRELADLEEHAGTGDGIVYATRGGKLPPGWSDRRFREAAPNIEGAYREGGLRGRSVTWYVAKPDFDRWLTNRAPHVERDSKPANVTPLEDWITGAGFRTTKAVGR